VIPNNAQTGEPFDMDTYLRRAKKHTPHLREHPLTQFGKLWGVPGLEVHPRWRGQRRALAVPLDVVLHLLRHLDLRDISDFDNELFTRLSPGGLCIGCKGEYVRIISGKLGIPICGRCENVVLQLRGLGEKGRAVCVYAFGKEILPPHILSNIYTIAFDRDLVKDIGHSRSLNRLFVVSSDFAWHFFVACGIVEDIDQRKPVLLEESSS